jgi:hypothetical protein
MIRWYVCLTLWIMNAWSSYTLICKNRGRYRCLTLFIIIELTYCRYEWLIIHTRNETVVILKTTLVFSIINAGKKKRFTKWNWFSSSGAQWFFDVQVVGTLSYPTFTLLFPLIKFSKWKYLFFVGNSMLFSIMATLHNDRKPISFLGNLSISHTSK